MYIRQITCMATTISIRFWKSCVQILCCYPRELKMLWLPPIFWPESAASISVLDGESLRKEQAPTPGETLSMACIEQSDYSRTRPQYRKRRFDRRPDRNLARAGNAAIRQRRGGWHGQYRGQPYSITDAKRIRGRSRIALRYSLRREVCKSRPDRWHRENSLPHRRLLPRNK